MSGNPPRNAPEPNNPRAQQGTKPNDECRGRVVTLLKHMLERNNHPMASQATAIEMSLYEKANSAEDYQNFVKIFCTRINMSSNNSNSNNNCQPNTGGQPVVQQQQQQQQPMMMMRGQLLAPRMRQQQFQVVPGNLNRSMSSQQPPSSSMAGFSMEPPPPPSSASASNPVRMLIGRLPGAGASTAGMMMNVVRGGGRVGRFASLNPAVPQYEPTEPPLFSSNPPRLRPIVQEKPPSAPNFINDSAASAASADHATCSIQSAPPANSSDPEKSRLYQECISFIPTIKAFLGCAANGTVRVSDSIIHKARALMHPFERSLDITSITLQRVMSFIENSLIPVIAFFRIPLQRPHQPLTQLQESYLRQLKQRTPAAASQPAPPPPQQQQQQQQQQQENESTGAAAAAVSNSVLPAATTTTAEPASYSSDKDNNDRLSTASSSDEIENDRSAFIGTFFESFKEAVKRNGDNPEPSLGIKRAFEQAGVQLPEVKRQRVLFAPPSSDSSDDESNYHHHPRQLFRHTPTPKVRFEHVAQLLRSEIENAASHHRTTAIIKQLNELVRPSDPVFLRIRPIPLDSDREFIPPFRVKMQLVPPNYNHFNAKFDFSDVSKTPEFDVMRDPLRAKANAITNDNMNLLQLIQYAIN